MKTLETERLILRLWRDSDLEDLYEYASEEGVGVHAGWPRHESIEDSRKILNRFIAAADVYAVVDKETGKVIGSVGAHIRPRDGDPRKSREIGYALKKSYWNRGLTTEAVRAVIEYFFTETDIEVLWCGHFDYNRASKRVIEKCGFRYYDEETRELPRLGKTIRSLRYIMTREDYLNSRD